MLFNPREEDIQQVSLLSTRLEALQSDDQIDQDIKLGASRLLSSLRQGEIPDQKSPKDSSNRDLANIIDNPQLKLTEIEALKQALDSSIRKNEVTQLQESKGTEHPTTEKQLKTLTSLQSLTDILEPHKKTNPSKRYTTETINLDLTFQQGKRVTTDKPKKNLIIIADGKNISAETLDRISSLNALESTLAQIATQAQPSTQKETRKKSKQLQKLVRRRRQAIEKRMNIPKTAWSVAEQIEEATRDIIAPVMQKKYDPTFISFTKQFHPALASEPNKTDVPDVYLSSPDSSLPSRYTYPITAIRLAAQQSQKEFESAVQAEYEKIKRKKYKGKFSRLCAAAAKETSEGKIARYLLRLQLKLRGNKFIIEEMKKEFPKKSKNPNTKPSQMMEAFKGENDISTVLDAFTLRQSKTSPKQYKLTTLNYPYGVILAKRTFGKGDRDLLDIASGLIETYRLMSPIEKEEQAAKQKQQETLKKKLEEEEKRRKAEEDRRQKEAEEKEQQEKLKEEKRKTEERRQQQKLEDLLEDALRNLFVRAVSDLKENQSDTDKQCTLNTLIKKTNLILLKVPQSEFRAKLINNIRRYIEYIENIENKPSITDTVLKKLKVLPGQLEEQKELPKNMTCTLEEINSLHQSEKEKPAISAESPLSKLPPRLQELSIVLMRLTTSKTSSMEDIQNAIMAAQKETLDALKDKENTPETREWIATIQKLIDFIAESRMGSYKSEAENQPWFKDFIGLPKSLSTQLEARTKSIDSHPR